MSQEATATDVKIVVTDVDPVAAALAEQKAKIIDAAVREARADSWCGEFERVLQRIFPEGSGQPNGDWYDSDGMTCRGRDLEGFDAQGWDAEGYGRDTFNPQGRDRAGFHRDTGLDLAGFNRDGVHQLTGIRRDSEEYTSRFRYDTSGYGVDGFNAENINRNGSTREQRARACVYDEDGYNINGRDRYGYTREQNGGGRGQ